MIAARRRNLYPLDADPKVWATRYGIEPFSCPCEVCGAPLTSSVPFANGELRGLEVPACACGNKQRSYCVVRDARYGDLFGVCK